MLVVDTDGEGHGWILFRDGVGFIYIVVRSVRYG